MSNALRRLDAWLLSEGIQEARAVGNHWLADLWVTLAPDQMTEAERDGLNDVLWPR